MPGLRPKRQYNKGYTQYRTTLLVFYNFMYLSETKFIKSRVELRIAPGELGSIINYLKRERKKLF